MVVLFTTRRLCTLLTQHKGNILCSNKFVLGAQFFSNTSTVKSKPSLLLLTVIGAGAGVAVGGGYSLYVTEKARLPILNKNNASAGYRINAHPDVKISRRVSL